MELKENYGNFKVLVPGKSLNEISKILNGGVDDDKYLFYIKSYSFELMTQLLFQD